MAIILWFTLLLTCAVLRTTGDTKKTPRAPWSHILWKMAIENRGIIPFYVLCWAEKKHRGYLRKHQPEHPWLRKNQPKHPSLHKSQSELPFCHFCCLILPILLPLCCFCYLILPILRHLCPTTQQRAPINGVSHCPGSAREAGSVRETVSTENSNKPSKPP